MSSVATESKDLSDEEWRKLLKPCVSQAEASAILTEHYASPGQPVKIIKVLDSYDDVNFMVGIGETTYLFKIHNGVESREYLKVLKEAAGEYYKASGMKSGIHLQNAIMETLDENKITTTTPVRPLSAKRGNKSPPLVAQKLPVVAAAHSPTFLVCRLLTWVHGTPMASVKLLPLEALADAGRFLGRVDRALDRVIPDVGLVALRRVESQGFEHTVPALAKMLKKEEGNTRRDQSLAIPAQRYHQWDGKNTGDLRSFTQYIADEKRRGLVLSVLDACQKEIIDSGDCQVFRTGLNHGDFNDANIIVDDQLQVSGVIDFGDSVESWRVLDLTVAMAYAMICPYGKTNRSVSAAAAFLRGYNSVEPLTNVERKHLVLLMACRLSCSVTLGAFSYQQNPENEYLLLHAEPAWKALELLWCYDEEERWQVKQAVNRVFRQACLYTDSSDQIIACYDLVFPDPGVADLLQSVRVSSVDVSDRPKKKARLDSPIKDRGASTITFVTGNQGKLEEVRRILHFDGASTERTQLPFHLTNAKVDLPELQGTPEEVAKAKCLAAVKEIGGAAIVEDTSLCFNALKGLPGIYIKWFLDAVGNDGLNKMLLGFDDKSAYAQTVVAFCPGPGKETAIVEGRTTGKIVQARGALGFGWDPIFEPDEGNGKTYAEMSKEEKDVISHRRRALVKLREYFEKFCEEMVNDMA